MATDYDAPRETEGPEEDSPVEELKNRQAPSTSPQVDEDESEAAESFELPGADLSHEELSVQVVPRQSDEFTCGSCFLVKHHSQADHQEGELLVCTDCAA
ncbi:MAG TPA: DUF4193 domain-containing protein [Brevibacterium sp.]|nr:DUF4193 domain-containing protein [Brevibacterium sp.]